MVARSSKLILQSLLKKGFVARTGHHVNLALHVDGVYKGVSTYISHGNKDYGDALLSSMSKQLHLSKAELLEFIDCQMSGDDYLVLLRERGHIA